jgi:SagB-type dehydrogenase family enzyme
MRNTDLQATWAYHDGTKHSYASVRRGPGGPDWANRPLPYKVYTTLPPLPLPRDGPLPARPALDALAGVPERGAGRIPHLAVLAGLCRLSAGITRRLRLAGGQTIAFRAASCTGALYHVELYLVCGRLPDLEAGLYHFGVHDSALRRLRAGDFRSVVVEASGHQPAVAAAPVVAVLTTTFWRNAWKYRARAYRHAFWDGGTILANLLAVAAGYDLPARLVVGFVDATVNRLLDVDPHREVAIALVALGRDGSGPADGLPPMPALALPTQRLSPAEVDYPAIRAMHAASSLTSPAEVRAWREGRPPYRGPGGTGAARRGMVGDGPAPRADRLTPLRPVADADLPRDAIARVILRRGSARRFLRQPITFAQLSTMLDRATRPLAADFLPAGSWDGLAGPAAALTDVYLIVHAVEGLPAGTFVYHRDRRGLELLRAGTFRREAGYLALEQTLAADAAVNVYVLAALPPILARFGNRGYRAAQLEAAIVGGRLYLAAHALGLGATGLTFYDDDVTAFFSPHAHGKSVMFLTALGVPARRTPHA